MIRHLIKRKASDLLQLPETGEFFRVYRNMFWLSDEEENLYFYKDLMSPQCNSNTLICERRIKNGHKIFTKVLFFEKIFVQFDPYEFVGTY